MKLRFYRVMGSDGFPMHGELAKGEALPEGGHLIDRLPEPFEDWDGKRFVVRDVRARADWMAGPAHIAEARSLKYSEAVGFAMGGDTPMLTAEAKEMGIKLADLVALVLEKRADFIAAEVARQRGQAGKSD